METVKKDLTKLYSVDRYAKSMGVDKRTVYNWLKDKEKGLKQIEISGKKFIDLSA